MIEENFKLNQLIQNGPNISDELVLLIIDRSDFFYINSEACVSLGGFKKRVAPTN